MPRISNKQYLDRRRVVLREWLDRSGGVLARLTMSEQHHLHDYFATTKQLNQRDAIAFRKAITKRRPGLASQAGRAYQELEAAKSYCTKLAVPRPVPGVPSERTVSVALLVRPEIDVRRLTRALIATATTKGKDPLQKTPRFL